MEFAKLQNDVPVFAGNPLMVAGNWCGNLPEEPLRQMGYKPVRRTESGEAPAGWCYREVWTETEEEILQSWELCELPEGGELDAEDALNILLGGETV